MQIEPVTHPGHTTTYTYKVNGAANADGGTVEINASNTSGVGVYGMPDGPHRFESLKSALNFVLGAPD